MAVKQHTGINHFWHESMTWERTLDFYLQENAFYKTRLSQTLEEKIEREMLEKAEYFQNSFIEMDEHIKDSRKNIQLFQRMLKNIAEQNIEDFKRLTIEFRKLDHDIMILIKGFEKIKKAFAKYLIQFMGSDPA